MQKKQHGMRIKIMRSFNVDYNYIIAIVNEGKSAHFSHNFTLDKIKLVQIMNNQVYFVRNTCYFDVQ